MVGCCNINFSCLQGLYIFVVLFARLQLIRCHIWPTFHPANPNFFRMFMGNYLEMNRERKNFRVYRFPNMERKSFFCTVLRSQPNIFLHFLPGIVEEHAKKKNDLTIGLKNSEPGEQNVRF